MVFGGPRDGDGRFVGPRLDVESSPRLPATVVALALSRPVYLVWSRDGKPCDQAALELGDGRPAEPPDAPPAPGDCWFGRGTVVPCRWR